MAVQSSMQDDEPFPVKTVAIIGAGISGLLSAVHLRRRGVQVTVFERSAVAGGVWQYTDTIPKDTAYPCETPSVGEYEASRPGQYALDTPLPEAAEDDGELDLDLSSPSPCYKGLMTNIPSSLCVSSVAAWPEGTPVLVHHSVVREYVERVAADYGINDITHFNTRVEEVKKSANGKTWTLRTINLEASGAKPRRVTEKMWEFDAVLVASGHNNMARVPNFPGLKEWKASFGNRVIHSRQYRDPEVYRDKNVLVIGGSVSSLNICQEVDPVAKNVYQSVRHSAANLSVKMLGQNCTRRVASIERFELPTDSDAAATIAADDSAPIPARIILSDGEVIENIHHVVVATGYITTFPFLFDLHEDDKPAAEAGPRTLVTSEGDMVHNLFRDLFYIEDPTLCFLGLTSLNATFSCFDFQAQVLARVLAGKALLPSREAMREEYKRTVEEKGYGRRFHALRPMGGEPQYVKDLVEWANKDLEITGAEPMEGHSEQWLQERQAFTEYALKTFWDMPPAKSDP